MQYVIRQGTAPKPRLKSKLYIFNSFVLLGVYPLFRYCPTHGSLSYQGYHDTDYLLPFDVGCFGVIGVFNFI